MKKIARPAYWDKIERGLRSITNLPSSVHSYLGNPNKIKFHDSLPQGVSPAAKAYVSTEDLNNDGDIETINIVVTNLQKEWPQDVLSKINQMDDSDPVFQSILTGVAKTLIHEIAHIDDHNLNKKPSVTPDPASQPSTIIPEPDPFPGKEGVAESKENAFTPIFRASSIINYDNKVKIPLELSKVGEIKMKKDLIKLANHLDNLGHSDLADRLDAIVVKAYEGVSVNQIIEKSASDTAKDLSVSGEQTSSSDRIKKLSDMIASELGSSGGLVSRK